MRYSRGHARRMTATAKAEKETIRHWSPKRPLPSQLVGALTGGWLSDKVGRRMGLALFAIPGIIGWVVIATARPWGGLIPLAVTCAGKTLPLPCVFATAFVGKTLPFLAVPRPGARRVLDRRALFANAGAVVLLHPPLTSVDVSNRNGGGGQIGGSNRCQQLQYRARYC